MKANLKIIFCFTVSFALFLIFAADYTYHKDFFTWLHLLSSMIWWTLAMMNFIRKCTSCNDCKCKAGENQENL